MATHWDLEAIAEALGSSVRERKRGVFGVELHHPTLGTRLKLDMAPSVDALRLFCDRLDDGHLTVLGRIDLFEIAIVTINVAEGWVRFGSVHQLPTELEVSDEATFVVTVGERSNPGRRAPAAADNELVRLVGHLARPHCSEATGKPFFTAGLAEHPDGATAPVWHNHKAFGGVAREGKHLERGAWVRLIGKSQVDRYHKDGQEQIRPVILLVHIEAAGQN
jgi:hypothetical protein